ncbi:MAG: threonine-phosphate decarboxylase CobD [Alcanivorax sp.]|uniref:threonine-phosphate decarboxylase CobD n=1 Tax=Alcanivorax sp. TaxID=1872427 RepID=UPI00260DC178|nr:threonine-phosphate decarboxylase CobD [Alcanivorax sp.]MDF1724238.1 threonine-phosphate decarboxylase CobD [Alcanivorax sp.]
MSVIEREHHGGRLHEAARRWGIPVSDWLDLSTGISPFAWPVPTLPASVWQRLPEEDDGLTACCRHWLAVPAGAACLPVPGSQAALQLLPRLRKTARVGVPSPGYREHALAWQRAGHEVVPLSVEQIDGALPDLDVLVCINPNNPTGHLYPQDTLLRWHQQLAAKGGWLVVDEAFLEASDGESLAARCDQPGLIVLRSLGKFFGLAGLRAGVMVGPAAVCEALADLLGPWAMSHPARWVMARAVQDRDWQQRQRECLRQARLRLDGLLSAAGLLPQGDSDLFALCVHDEAEAIRDGLARQAILVRHFEQPGALRFGLPGNESEEQRLLLALQTLPV